MPNQHKRNNDELQNQGAAEYRVRRTGSPPGNNSRHAAGSSKAKYELGYPCALFGVPERPPQQATGSCPEQVDEAVFAVDARRRFRTTRRACRPQQHARCSGSDRHHSEHGEHTDEELPAAGKS